MLFSIILLMYENRLVIHEDDVTDIIVNSLENNGFIIEDRNKGTRGGVDIIAKKDGLRYIIEAQGNKRKKDGNIFTGSQIDTHCQRVIGKLVLRMSQYPNSIYILALPNDERYIKMINIAKLGLEKLGIQVWFISPNWKYGD